MSGIKSNGKPGDHMISQCKRCRFGIFNRQPRVWQTGSTPGLVHVDCNNPYGGTP